MTTEDPTPYEWDVFRTLMRGIFMFVDARNERLVARAIKKYEDLCKRGVDPKIAEDAVLAEFHVDLDEITPEMTAYAKDLLAMGEGLLKLELDTA